MADVLMVDSAANLVSLIPAMRARGLQPAVAAVYLGNGGCGAFVATPAYVQSLHRLGLAVFPVFNGAGIDAGHAGTPAQAAVDIATCEQQLLALGAPAGVYVGWDVERLADARLQGGYLAAVGDWFRASRWGGAGVVYAACLDPAFGEAFDGALALTPANANRFVFWQASYVGTDPGAALPDWDTPKIGPTAAPWDAAHKAQIGAWQYWTDPGGPWDLSVARLPWPQFGTEGLWLPSGKVGFPAP